MCGDAAATVSSHYFLSRTLRSPVPPLTICRGGHSHQAVPKPARLFKIISLLQPFTVVSRACEPRIQRIPRSSRHPDIAGASHRFCRDVANPSSCARDRFLPIRALTDETLGLHSQPECGDPVCRPIRLSQFNFAGFADLRKALSAICSGPTGQRGTIISGRFRGCKLVGSSRHSKHFFAGLQCLAIMAYQCCFPATRARGTPLRSGCGGRGASPAAANNAATGSA
jgi:hypothetical protein